MSFKITALLASLLLVTGGSSQKPWVKYPVGSTLQYCQNKVYDFAGSDLSNDWIVDSGKYSVANNTLTMTMHKGPNNRGVATIIKNGPWFSQYMTMRADIKLQFTPGVVYTWILRANGTEEGRDEIDFEWTKSSTSAQSNVFANNHVIYGTYGRLHELGDVNQWNTYEITWNEDSIVWSICPLRTNCRVVRTWNAKDSFDNNVKDYIFPTKPMRIEFGLWDTTGQAPGTVEWAGGPTDWSKFPNGISYQMRNLSVTCHKQNAAPGYSFVNDKNSTDPKGSTTSTTVSTTASTMASRTTSSTDPTAVRTMTTSTSTGAHQTQTARSRNVGLFINSEDLTGAAMRTYTWVPIVVAAFGTMVSALAFL